MNGRNAGILEAEKLGLTDNQFYHSLLGNLYNGMDYTKALKRYENALAVANSPADQATIRRNIRDLIR